MLLSSFARKLPRGAQTSRSPHGQDHGFPDGVRGHAQAQPRPRGLWGPAGADYGQISEETWVYLNSLYGGGPEIAIRQSVAQLQDPESLHGEQKIEAETRAV